MASVPLRRNHDFVLLWSGEALSELGSQASSVAYPLLVLALTGSPAQAGLVGLAKWLPLAVAALPAGVLADRFDRKRLMIASDAVRALLLASIPVALWLGRPSFAQVAVVAFLDGCLFTLRYVCERGALAHVVEPAQLPQAVAQNEARTFAANLLGPLLGGVMFAVARALPFLVDAASYLASMVSVALTRAPFQDRADASEDGPARLRGIGDGLAWLWRHRFFRTSALVFAAGNPLYIGLYLLAILVARHHGASPGEIGAMLAVVGCGGLVGALVAGSLRDVLRPRTALVGEVWLLACVLPLLFMAHSALLIGLIVGVCELPTPLANSVVSGYRVALTPDRLRGRVQAAGTLVTMSLGWLGPLAVGVIFQRAGANATVLVMVGWALLLAVATTLAPGLHSGPPALGVARAGIAPTADARH